jgi:hypothetical protein
LIFEYFAAFFVLCIWIVVLNFHGGGLIMSSAPHSLWKSDCLEKGWAQTTELKAQTSTNEAQTNNIILVFNFQSGDQGNGTWKIVNGTWGSPRPG